MSSSAEFGQATTLNKDVAHDLEPADHQDDLEEESLEFAEIAGAELAGQRRRQQEIEERSGGEVGDAARGGRRLLEEDENDGDLENQNSCEELESDLEIVDHQLQQIDECQINER